MSGTLIDRGWKCTSFVQKWYTFLHAGTSRKSRTASGGPVAGVSYRGTVESVPISWRNGALPGGVERELELRRSVGGCGLFGEVFPQGAEHRSLNDLAVLHEAEDFVGVEEMECNVFGSFEVLVGQAADAGGDEAVAEIGAGAGVWGGYHIQCPCAFAVAGLLEEFPAGCLLRGLAAFAHSCRDFVAYFAAAVAVLALQYHAAVVCDGDDVDPVGVFEHIVFGVDHSVWKLYPVTAGGEPGTAD